MSTFINFVLGTFLVLMLVILGLCAFMLFIEVRKAYRKDRKS